jgi:TonB family protein
MSDPTRAGRPLTATEMPTTGFGLERGEAESSDFFEVRIANRAPVRIEYSAIRELRAQLTSGAECVGLLLGSSSREALSIQRCELLTLSAATLADPKSLQGAFRQFIKARLQNPIDTAPELVGCFRSQTDGWPGMKGSDVDIVKQNFAGPNQLFLAIRTPQHRPWLAALYALDTKNATTSREPVAEFPFDEYLLRNGYLTDLMETTETDDFPEQSGRPWRSGSRWMIAALLATILLGGSALAYKFKSKWYRPLSRIEITGSSTPNSAAGLLSLKVTRSDKDFEVSWDRLSPAVQQSSSGRLTINDGALTRTVDLSGSQLREGHILYTPLFEELTFRLEVASPDLGASAESVQVLAWSGKQPADLTAVLPPQPAADIPTAKPPARVPAAKTPAPPVAASRVVATPVTASPSSAKNAAKPAPAASVKTAAVTAPPANTPVSNAGNKQEPPQSGEQPPKSSVVTETARVIQPSSPNSERSPAPQITPPAPASSPASQPPAAPQPTPDPQPPRQSTIPTPVPLPAASSPQPLSPPSLSPPAAASSTVSGGVFAAPVPIQKVAPALPRSVVPAGSPRVTAISIRALIDSAGNVQSVQLVSSTPKGIFGETVIQKAALDAAKKWKFQPGQLNGKNVAGEYTIDFQFQ